uniref:Uncharacterized protein n=1 Tax=Anguilla anguilla TaxID=7936 RepID=A0A0E9T8W1_ANGAN
MLGRYSSDIQACHAVFREELPGLPFSRIGYFWSWSSFQRWKASASFAPTVVSKK